MGAFNIHQPVVGGVGGVQFMPGGGPEGGGPEGGGPEGGGPGGLHPSAGSCLV